MKKDCQHTFCKGCVSRIQMQHPNQTKKCPICREPFNPIQVMLNFGLHNYMAELRRNRSRSPRNLNLRARGSIGRVIHQPRTPPELIPAPVTPPELIQARASQDSRRLLNESNLTHRIERTLKGYAN